MQPNVASNTRYRIRFVHNYLLYQIAGCKSGMKIDPITFDSM